ncbi:MAG: hypothetical protein FWH27_02665 [Planctomycetaceae bacterium]|nr:hypothetical protein [Planctomycetaceae bacterium]
MDYVVLLGIALVVLAGLGTGTGIWPMKLMKRFQFEHYWFIAMLTGLVVLPWAIVLTRIPHPFAAYAQVGWEPILKANLFALGWGVANVLYGLCVIRIGAALTGAILTGLGIIAGTTLPMVMKGTGLFANAPDLTSTSGLVLLAGLAVMLLGVLFSSLAGFGRAKALSASASGSSSPSLSQGQQGSFAVGLLMAVIAGLTSAGISLSFVYGQAPIVEAMKSQGADTMSANVAVWAVALMGGAAVNIIFPVWIMTKKKNWNVLLKNPGEALFATVAGIQFIIAISLMGRGMLFLGAFGASVGFAIQQIMQIMGNQAVGFLSGEWKNVYGNPRRLMYLALAILAVAVTIIASSNALVR